MKKTKTALLGTLIGAVWTAATLAATTFTITRITDSESCSREPSISGNGRVVAFASTADLTGDNGDGNFELFTYDVKTGDTAQITDTENMNDSGLEAQVVNKTGSRIAFVAAADVTGDNADENAELFLFHRKDGITQITNTTGGFIDSLSMNVGGSRIAFVSNNDLVTGHNTDGNNEVFLFHPKTGITQITETTSGTSLDTALNKTGSRLVFASTSDLTGGNGDSSEEIFTFDKKGGLTQITSAAGCESFQPAVNHAGTRIAFGSSCDLVGSNADGNGEIFVADTKTGGLSQVTSSSGCFNFLPDMNGRGNRIAFVSSCDLLGTNADDNIEIFLFDDEEGLTQITNGAGGQEEVAGPPSLSTSGKRIAFELNGELTGDNTDGEGEIYIAEQD